jgi:hypothetical protein
VYNLPNRRFLEEIDFTSRELDHLLTLAAALKAAKYAGKVVWHERVRLLAPYQVNAQLHAISSSSDRKRSGAKRSGAGAPGTGARRQRGSRARARRARPSARGPVAQHARLGKELHGRRTRGVGVGER